MVDALLAKLWMLQLLFPDETRQRMVASLVDEVRDLLADREQLVFNLGRFHTQLNDLLTEEQTADGTKGRLLTEAGVGWLQSFLSEHHHEVESLIATDEWAMVSRLRTNPNQEKQDAQVASGTSDPHPQCVCRMQRRSPKGSRAASRGRKGT